MVRLSTIAATGAFLLGKTVSSPLPTSNPGSEPIAFYNLNNFEDKYWHNGAICSWAYPYEWSECLAATDNATWTAMTYNPSHANITHVWSKDDTAMATCLTKLHHQSDTRCISVKGSECEHVAQNSTIANSRSITVRQLDSKTVEILQKAGEAMVGMNVTSKASEMSHGGVHFMRINQKRRNIEGLSNVEENFYGDVSFYFEDDGGCDRNYTETWAGVEKVEREG
ncbi:hypothetical protein G7Y79_00020g049120 [Physcia stellaris]|nr:hypothetical protein G7Y79_00020g049120 [Physcia stellaris]